MIALHYSPQYVECGLAMVALYVDRMLTTINLVITILEQGSSLNMMCRLIVPRGEMESLVSLINEEVIGLRLLVESTSF